MTAKEKSDAIENLKADITARKEKIGKIKDEQIRPLQSEIVDLKTQIKDLKAVVTSEPAEPAKPAKAPKAADEPAA